MLGNRERERGGRRERRLVWCGGARGREAAGRWVARELGRWGFSLPSKARIIRTESASILEHSCTWFNEGVPCTRVSVHWRKRTFMLGGEVLCGGSRAPRLFQSG